MAIYKIPNVGILPRKQCLVSALLCELLLPTRNEKTDFTEFYNLIYEYKNDCLTASVQYNKDYYSDNELKPTEEIFFSISIVPLATFNTPSAR